jgi:CHASE1-domain containing sensor protein
MTLHWMHVTAGYVVVLGTFLALGLGAALRHRAARRLLERLDTRAAARQGRGGAA